MLNTFWRQKKVRQDNLTEVQFKLIAGVSPSAAGIDKAFVKSIVRNALGSYTVTFQEGAFQDVHPVYLHVDGLGIAQAAAVTEDSITIDIQDNLGAAADLNVNVGIVWMYKIFVR